jgi:hypothetical protein
VNFREEVPPDEGEGIWRRRHQVGVVSGHEERLEVGRLIVLNDVRHPGKKIFIKILNTR